jgi:hypothetical protein
MSEYTAIVSKYSDHDFVERVGGSVRLPKPRLVAGYKAGVKSRAASLAGGDPSDYAVILVPSTNQAFQRLLDGDEFELTWTDEDTFSISFAPDDARFEAVFSVSAPTLPANNTATVTVTMTIRRKSDGSVAAGIPNMSFLLPVQRPNGSAVSVQGQLQSGVATWSFKCPRADAGVWKFPGDGFSYPGLAPMRAGNEAYVDAYLTGF